jgi:hypothetical protein
MWRERAGHVTALLVPGAVFLAKRAIPGSVKQSVFGSTIVRVALPEIAISAVASLWRMLPKIGQLPRLFSINAGLSKTVHRVSSPTSNH